MRPSDKHLSQEATIILSKTNNTRLAMSYVSEVTRDYAWYQSHAFRAHKNEVLDCTRSLHNLSFPDSEEDAEAVRRAVRKYTLLLPAYHRGMRRSAMLLIRCIL